MYVEVILGKAVGKGASRLTYFSSLPVETGSIVEVPLMRGRVPGVVYKKVAQPDFKCREILKILYSKPLPEHLLKTAEWMADYYAVPLSAVMGMMLPVGMLKKRRGTSRNSVSSTRSRRELVVPLNHAQKKALEALQKPPGGTKLLLGVTGSGKTNIYLTEAARALTAQ